MTKLENILYTDKKFEQVLKLRYRLLDVPVGAPEITEPSDNDKNPNNVHVVAIDNDRVISAVRFDKVEAGDFIVRRMITDPEYQRRGIGRSVMGLLETLAKDNDGSRILLNSTPDAIDFYHALGYKDTGGVIEWAGVNHTEMAKDL